MSGTSALIVHPAPPPGLGIDARIAWLAGRQHGLVTRTQLEALGLSRHQIAGRVSRGLLLRVHHTVYALGIRPSSVEGRALAAVLACGGGAVASHGSAAALHGMLPGRRGPVHVTTPPPIRAVRGVHLHVSASCGPTTSAVSGVPCTRATRTLVDIAATDGEVAAARAWASLAGRRRLRPRAMEQELRAYPGRPGSVAVRALLEAHRLTATGRTRSELEAAALHVCATHGLPAPGVNRLVRLDEATYEADLLWEDARLIVELDGWNTHGDADSFRRDRRRDFDFDLAGWSSVRLVWDDVTLHAAATAERLRRRLAQGR